MLWFPPGIYIDKNGRYHVGNDHIADRHGKEQRPEKGDFFLFDPVPDFPSNKKDHKTEHGKPLRVKDEVGQSQILRAQKVL